MLIAVKDGKAPNASEAKEIFDTNWTTGEVNSEKVELSRPGAIKFSKADFDESLMTDEEFAACRRDKIDPSWVTLRKKAYLIIDAYLEQIIPRIKKVHFVQRYVELKNSAGDTFIGYIDFCATWEDGKTYIFDNKTSSIKYAADSVEKSEQLATYKEALTDELKIDGAGYVVIPKHIRKKKLPKVPIEVIVGAISEELIDNTFQMYDDVLAGIKVGDFPCTPEKCCSTPWGCAYKAYCRSGGTDLTGLIYHKERKK